MSAITTTPPSCPITFTQLARRLRQTNVRYHQIAYQFRRARRLTYHAKRRAYLAGLRIDTSKACATGRIYEMERTEVEYEYRSDKDKDISEGEQLSPLELGLSFDVVSRCPGAPRLVSKPLPVEDKDS